MTTGTPAAVTVVKIGGSTLGAQDTSLQDVVALQQAGARPLVVHGGGALISDWLQRLAIPSTFIDGLRATNAEALAVVVGVLRGVVNTQLVAAIGAIGGRAVGLSGVDGGMVSAQRYDQRLGYVGRVTGVDTALLEALLEAGLIPVIAPIGLEAPAQPLNINADTMAGELARALGAEQLIFLTDVDGLLDAAGTVVEELDAARAGALRAEGTLTGGMMPKVDACFRAAETGVAAFIVNGTLPHIVHRIVRGERAGTRIRG